ncbi:hypothetical protein D8674_024372 [Pyrus ussuriensis x Pyrus communis]|uniref:Uncharacterized protein n=1 Tax=Pyrus ussuriensis x Pyrus communis TaxID=2448454 RepID=A0A5N5H9U0_9ROSA|nr:hypothetical protein D8674_024372 [Pyrus ussuriensis x Pyrus communis]
MDNAKPIEKSVEQRLENDDDNDFFDHPPASKKRKMEKQQVAKKDKTVVAPNGQKGDVDDEMIGVQQQDDNNDDERTIPDVPEKCNDQIDDEDIQMTPAAWKIKTQSQDKLKSQDDDPTDKMVNPKNKNKLILFKICLYFL